MRVCTIVVSCLWAVLLPADSGGFLLSAALKSPVPIGNPQAVTLAHIDQDAALDAVVVGGEGVYADSYGCYQGDGSGGFGAAVVQSQLRNQPNDVVVGDFDADGILDIAAINAGACG